ncbi:MAG: putative inorganic polyphosphate/ATP-NAD kinase [Halothiobacillaceae bacterium]|nr:MAG: putative inorganic polyphosphate/ATP-NAD kinase [Halothiobacillaceae bacterium]
MNPPFHTIGIIGKQHAPVIKESVTTLVNFLLAHHFKVMVNASAAQYLERAEVLTADYATIGDQCDLAIVVGGDGTFLAAARSLCDYTIPLLGVNEGRLGFLVDISPPELLRRMEEILLRQSYISEERCLLHAEVFRNGKSIGEGNGFNDIILHKWNMARMIEFDTYVDDHLLNSQRSDGLIVATPTGSTAYALSGGGPLLHPTLDAIVLVPICPHTLTNRPIVVTSRSTIKLIVNDCHRDHAQLACDGHINIPLQEHDQVIIRKKERPIRLIHPADHDHFEVLRVKLRWG